MLNPRNTHDRFNYGDLLAPPDGYVLTKAVGTTYSLDLYALLAIPVAMFYAKSMEGDFQQNRYDVLDAIRQSKDKVDLFCQRGKIQVPSKYNSLLAFMEGCIEEVTPWIENSSFHPKIWVLRFEKGGEQLFRLIILSRNLTFDRSWDMVYFSEGIPTKQNMESKKICNYLTYFYSKTKRPIDTVFMKNLGNVEFKNPSGFYDFELFPILGFEKNITKFPNPLTSAVYDDMLIISPFVDSTTLSILKKNNKHLNLFSRSEELDKLTEEDLKDIECYSMNPLIVEGESYLDTEGIEPLSQNLHAKLFIGQNKKITDWYLGSANCTSPALGRNAEILAKISSAQSQHRIEEIKKTLLDEKYRVFSLYEATGIQTISEEASLDKAIRDLCFKLTKINFKGTIKKREEGDNYNVLIDANLTEIKNEIFNISVHLIHRETEQIEIVTGEMNTIEFENISLMNLSKFLGVTIYRGNEKHKSLLIKMEIEIPTEREDTIFNELINSKIKFFQYLQFILNPEQYTDSLEIGNKKGIAEKKETLQHLLGANNSIYESLMIAASRSPRKLKEIDGIIMRLQKLDSEVLLDFLPIWNVFKEFAHA